MATRKIVPRADNEGGLGTAAKRWATAFIKTATINILRGDTVGFEIGRAYGALIGIQEFLGKKWTDLGQQAAETQIRSIAYLGNGIAIAGSYPNGKIFRSNW